MARQRGPRKLGALALLAATYCIVSGGPFGLEDIVGKSGYLGAIVILVVTPIIWSVPTTLMVAELSAALPREGGYYAWVQIGLGPFWGFQEAWLTLAGSVFDMAIYPTLFSAYLGQLEPGLGRGAWPIVIGTGMVLVGVGWNLFSARAVGRGSLLLMILYLAPIAAIVGLSVAHLVSHGRTPAPTSSHHLDILGGIMIAMWNYMGWDNASTVAGEVEEPHRTYPWVMFWVVPLVTLGYLAPVVVLEWAGTPLRLWATGGWVDIGRQVGGPVLAAVVMGAAAVSTFSTFNALVLSLVRVPMAMADEGYLPRVFAWRQPRTGVPVVSLLACAATWAICQRIGFEGVVLIDVLLSGASVLLEFWALVALRVRQPDLPRPFRIPGGLLGAIAVGLPPLGLLILSAVRTASERLGATNGLWLAAVIAAVGPGLYFVSRALRAKPFSAPAG